MIYGVEWSERLSERLNVDLVKESLNVVRSINADYHSPFFILQPTDTDENTNIYYVLTQ